MTEDLDLDRKKEGSMLTFIKIARKEKGSKVFCLYKCDCGNVVEKDRSNVRKVHTKSCGCTKLQTGLDSLSAMPVHGYTKTQHPLYKLWNGIKKRTDPLSTIKKYQFYRDRGITMHIPWRDCFETFADYFKNTRGMGIHKPSKKHSLDRINNDGHYVPGNLRWATWLEQSENRSVSRMETYRGITKSIGGWEKHFGLKRNALRGRISAGFTIEEAIECPKGATLKTYRKLLDSHSSME